MNFASEPAGISLNSSVRPAQLVRYHTIRHLAISLVAGAPVFPSLRAHEPNPAGLEIHPDLAGYCL